jgi:hypothetical protein
VTFKYNPTSNTTEGGDSADVVSGVACCLRRPWAWDEVPTTRQLMISPEAG